MNLLLFNLATDEKHVTLGFAVRWIREIACYFDHVDVVTMYKGEYTLPANVSVWSVGKERDYSRLYRVWLFYRIVVSILQRRHIDVVFTHMIQIFALFFAPIARFKRIPNVLFYAHGNVDLSLKLAHRVVDRVLSSTPEGFRIPSDKVKFIGQGIDTASFSINDRRDPSCFHALSVSRISKVKGLDTLIEALTGWGGSGHPWILTLVGDATSEEEHRYKNKLLKRIESLEGEYRIEISGHLSSPEIAGLLNRADVFVNLSNTGSLDKAIVEAMASGCPILSCNRAFSALAHSEGIEICVVEPTPGSVRQGLDRIRDLDADARKDLAVKLRSIAVRDHDLKGLINRIVDTLYEVSGRSMQKV